MVMPDVYERKKNSCGDHGVFFLCVLCDLCGKKKEESMNMKKNLTLLGVPLIIVVFMVNFPGCDNIKASHLKANYYLKKANEYYAEEMYKWAAEEYETVLELNPDLKFVYAYLGTCYSSLYKPMADNEKNKIYCEKAVDYLLKAKEFEPENLQIIIALGDIYEKMGNIGKAGKYYQEILEKNPNDPNSYYLLAHFYAKNGELDSAEQMYQKRIGLNPQDPDGYHYYAGFLQDHRRWKEAIENHEKRLYALETTSKTFDMDKKQEVAEIYYSIGNVCWNWSYQTSVDIMSPRERNPIIEKGLKNLEKAIEIAPGYPDPYAYIGLLYREKIKVDPLKRDEYVMLNEKYNKKFTEIHQRKKRSEEYRKHLEEMGK
jgi:tetratricopeptide (TPR) repeat protein